MTIFKRNRFVILCPLTPHLETFIIGQTLGALAVCLKSERSNLGHRETPKFYKPITFEYNLIFQSRFTLKDCGHLSCYAGNDKKA
ncbi:MAG: hypothetical protein DRP78_06010 [Candidatus Omnitrophota bacterium]|nr:MAG: hypothetical protein DRP78_06010 [Candidatus Omnitrophota bacterium]